MKKLMMMAVMVATATSAFAQADVVKQAQKLCDSGNLDEALSTVTPALTNGTSEEKASAWNLLSDIQYKIYEKNHQVELENQVKKTTTPYDTTAMNKAVVAALEAALKCDEYDQQPNEKGKVKLKYRKANATKWQNGRLLTINAGLYLYNHKMTADAVKAWSLYVDSKDSPLFTGIDMSNDQYLSQVSYYAGLASYNLKDYANARKYALIAKQDTAQAKEANEILLFSQKESAKTKEDSLAYLQTIKDLHAENPNEQRYFNLLMDYFSKSTNSEEKNAWLNEEIAKNPNNKMAWALKGESDMNAQKWDEAIASYKKAIELDPDFVQVIFNTGVCLNSKAIDLKDKLADKKTGGLTTANANKVKTVLNEALTYMENSRELDPNREKVNWAYPLYQIYYSLKNDAKAAEMEQLLNNK